MQKNLPLVTIAIPTYNRVGLLKRSIASAQRQTYKNVEIIISDNASTDSTELFCRWLMMKDGRIRYFRQPNNLGGIENFNWLLSEARGAYFMWLGDDDWIDPHYVESCLDLLFKNPSLALVSGYPVYYISGVRQFGGRVFDVLHVNAKHRIASYLFQVTDNGTFYGLFRMESIRQLRLSKRFAGDWYFLCDVLISGGFLMNSSTSVHRELGGASKSYGKLVRLYGLSRFARAIPSYYAVRAFRQHMTESSSFSSLQVGKIWVFLMGLIILTRPLTNIPYRLKRRLRTHML
jgi:glycosyltransferase involved in cell wall biosynthesis